MTYDVTNAQSTHLHHIKQTVNERQAISLGLVWDNGRDLHEARVILAGSFTMWCENELSFTYQTALNQIHVFENAPNREAITSFGCSVTAAYELCKPTHADHVLPVMEALQGQTQIGKPTIQSSIADRLALQAMEQTKEELRHLLENVVDADVRNFCYRQKLSNPEKIRLLQTWQTKGNDSWQEVAMSGVLQHPTDPDQSVDFVTAPISKILLIMKAKQSMHVHLAKQASGTSSTPDPDVGSCCDVLQRHLQKYPDPVASEALKILYARYAAKELKDNLNA